MLKLYLNLQFLLAHRKEMTALKIENTLMRRNRAAGLLLKSLKY